MAKVSLYSRVLSYFNRLDAVGQVVAALAFRPRAGALDVSDIKQRRLSIEFFDLGVLQVLDEADWRAGCRKIGKISKIFENFDKLDQMNPFAPPTLTPARSH